MSYYAPYKIGVYVSVSPSSGQKGKRAEPPKVKTGQKQKVSAFSCHLLLDICYFLRKGVSRDAERKGEVQNGLTSCLACQTGSEMIELCRFLRKGVSRDAEHYGEVENVVNSCFARQTGSASISLSVVDLFAPFLSEGGFSGLRTQ